jgi:hypothetical protein
MPVGTAIETGLIAPGTFVWKRGVDADRIFGLVVVDHRVPAVISGVRHEPTEDTAGVMRIGDP